MSGRPNALPWPSIDQLPRVICAKINRHFVVAESAAVHVQRWWRTLKGNGGKPVPSAAVFAGGYGGRLHRMLLKTPVFYSEKLDGTNVGKMLDGTLLGRRLQIEPSATSYQRCPLEPLRECSTADCLQELRAILADDESKIRRFALYGELCCNFGLYNYAARKLAKSWQVFGAVFQFADMESAKAAAARGASKGFACVSENDSPIVVVANSPALRDLLAKHNIPTVRAEGAASLCELVAQKKAWMTSESGEGLVLTVGGTNPKSFKWKISREPQSSSIQSLADLRASLAAGGEKQHLRSLLAPAVHELLADLFDVATHVDSLVAAETAKTAAKESAQAQAQAQALDPAAVRAAISSACSKFDAFDASFEAKGQAAVPELAAVLAAEVLGDQDLALPAGGKERKKAEKEVGALVKRFVGEQFGSWRALRRIDGDGAAASG